jgi:hypothetical protein
MCSSLFFLFALIVQCCHSADIAKSKSKSSPTFLKDIIKDQQAELDLEKHRKQQEQAGPASYLDKAMTSTAKVSGSGTTPKKVSKVSKEAAKLNINEATTAVVVVS